MRKKKKNCTFILFYFIRLQVVCFYYRQVKTRKHIFGSRANATRVFLATCSVTTDLDRTLG